MLLFVVTALPFLSSGQSALVMPLTRVPKDNEHSKAFARSVGLDPDDFGVDKSLYLAAAARSFDILKAMKAGEKGFIPLGAEPAVYYAEIGIGTPPQKFRVHLDSGSSTLGVYDGGCTKSACFSSSRCHPFFNKTASSSFSRIPCASTMCCVGGSNCVCASNGVDCGFEVHYVDGTAMAGPWSTEVVTIGEYNTTMQFGQITDPVGVFEPDGVDGIIGVAFARLNENASGKRFDTIIDRVAADYSVPKLFSMCFGKRGGAFLIGAQDNTHISGSYTSIYTDTSIGHWETIVSSIRIGAITITSSPFYAVIDSGTTLWYLPTSVANSIQTQLSNQCGGFNCDSLDYVMSRTTSCVRFTPDSGVPSIKVDFQSAARTATVSGAIYLKELCGVEGYVAYGIRGTSCGSSPSNPCIFGDSFMSAFTWTFDMDNSQISFADRSGCDDPVGSFATCTAGVTSSGSDVSMSLIAAWTTASVLVIGYRL